MPWPNKTIFFILSETFLHVYSQLCFLCLGTMPIYENSLAASLHPGLCCIPRHEKLHLHHCSVRADGRHSWDYSFHFPIKFLEFDLPIFLTFKTPLTTVSKHHITFATYLWNTCEKGSIFILLELTWTSGMESRMESIPQLYREFSNSVSLSMH